MKLSKRQLLYALGFIVIIAGIGGFFYYQNSPKEVTRYNFQGVELSFRDDLRAAKNISAYPSEEAILNTIWSADIQNITIVFTNSSDNQFTAVNSFEITFKLSVAYGQFGWSINFNGREVDSLENLNGSTDNLVIALVPPSLATDTGVELNDNVVYIRGKTPQEFDRATIKFIMSALNITV